MQGPPLAGGSPGEGVQRVQAVPHDVGADRSVLQQSLQDGEHAQGGGLADVAVRLSAQERRGHAEVHGQYLADPNR